MLSLTPLELIDHLAALIPPPRRYRHRDHGVLAPNAPLRAAAVALGGAADDDPSVCAEANPPSAVGLRNLQSPARYLWVLLLARLFESLPLVCPKGGAHRRIIAFLTEAAPLQRILAPIGEPTEPAPIAPARGPPAWDDDLGPTPHWDLIAQPDPGFEFDQGVSW